VADCFVFFLLLLNVKVIFLIKMADVNTAETVPPSQSGANSAFKGFAFSKVCEHMFTLSVIFEWLIVQPAFAQTSSAKPKLPVKSEKPQGEKIERLDKDAYVL
jgi:hypothetical protein